MAVIPAGTFLMGSPEGVGESDEEPQHRVTFARPFCMDRTEVSVSAYRACVRTGGCSAPVAYEVTAANFRAYCNWDRPDADDHPVNCVNWIQAKQFCEWSGREGGARRLPREAEWEYAARGSAGRTYAWGNTAPRTVGAPSPRRRIYASEANGFDGTRANFCGDECALEARLHHFSWITAMPGWHDAFGTTAPVTAFPGGATPEGVLNLTGNVWEWVEDVYAPDAYAHHDAEGIAAVDAAASSPSAGLHVIRGCGWDYDGSAAAWASTTFRLRNTPVFRDNNIGFRCARAVR